MKLSQKKQRIKHAIKFAEEGSFITCLSDVVINAIEIVQSTSMNEHVSFNYAYKSYWKQLFFLKA
jgi:hypothetical protein